MNKIFSKAALTLLELIIATMLVAVVLLGIFAINAVLGNNNQDYGQRYFVRSETQTTLNHILNNVSLAVGSAGGNTAILTEGQVGDAGTFCIHQNLQPGGAIDSPLAGNPSPDTSKDRWLCYTWYPAANPSCPASIPNCANGIVYCAIPFSSGAGPCNGNVNISAGPVYLGTAFADPAVTFSSQYLFSIKIQNCLNNANPPGTCSLSGTSTDPANNPEVQVSGSVYPSQVGP